MREGTEKTPEAQKEGNKPSEKGNDREETLAAMPWQREGGRLSRPPSAQRVHNVTGGPQASGAASDDEDTANTAEQQTRGRARTGLTAITPDRTNQQVGAPPGAGVQPAVPTSNRPSSAPSAGSESSAPFGGRSATAADLYPSFPPLTDSAGTGIANTASTSEQQAERPHAGDPAVLDEDFQECWWVREHEGTNVLARGWATRQGERAVVYTAGGGVWTGTVDEYAAVCPQIIEEVKAQQSARTLGLSRRSEAARKEAEGFLRGYRRETGGLPTRSTWRNAWQGEVDTGGRQITVRLKCHSCGMERVISLVDADTTPSLYQAKGFSCGVLRDVCCGETAPGRRGEPLALSRTRGPTARAEGLPEEEVKIEEQDGIGPEEDVEIVGFSTAAKQFYKARGPQLQTPVYRGESSEVDLLAWKRGIEKYFETYGVVRQREKVSLAADLLEGDAAKWWNGLWMSGRDVAITTWEELIVKLRERFLPPEGEMRVVGQWRRLQQTGSVAAYADHVFRLKALCNMGEVAEFKLAFYGLQPELQAEVRKHLRQNNLHQLELEKLFAIAQDAEVGLAGRFGRRGAFGGEGSGQPRSGAQGRKEANASAHNVLWEEGGRRSGQGRSTMTSSDKASEEGDWGRSGNRVSSRNSWGVSTSTGSGSAREDNMQARKGLEGAKSLSRKVLEADRDGRSESSTRCFICDKTGHGWFHCPQKKTGRGCFKCGSEGHQFSKCPQPTTTTTSGGWDMTGFEGSEGCSSSVFMMETYVMGVEETQHDPKLLYYPVTVRRWPTQALLDSGASVNCIDEALADKAGGVITHRAKGVLLYPDKRKADVRGVAEIEVRARGYCEKVSFWVVRGLGVPMLLGEPWLRSWNPKINWQTKELTFSDGVVWKAAAKEEEKTAFEKGRGWRLPSEGRLYHLIKGDGDESEDEEGETELPTWLHDMSGVFVEPEGVVKEDRISHKIRLKEGARAYQKAPFRLSSEQTNVLHKELSKFKGKGWIRPSRSEWATVALVVPKKDKTWRVCIDYRDLNAISEMDAYPLPRIEELFAKLARAKWFTKMDLKSGFHQIPMDEESIKYTAFRIGVPLDGCAYYEWTVMPMGLSTALASFQRWMEESLRGLESITLVYLDDVLVYSAEEEQHRKDVQLVLERFQEKKMRVALGKCEFAK